MVIPNYQAIMLPLLLFAGDSEEHSLQEAVDSLADYFDLTDEELRELLPSGQQALFRNRLGWARSYLKQAALLESTRRGYFRITQRGLDVTHRNPSKVDVNFLDQFEEFREFRKRRRSLKDKNKELPKKY